MSEPAVAISKQSQAIDVAAASARRWWILAVVGLAQLMVVLDATIVNIALPSAQHDLGFSNTDRQWVVTAYALAFGGLLLLGGRLSDLVGRRRMLIIGLIGFAAASALGGAATSFAILVIGRGAQGAFGAMLAPAALSTLTVTFTDPAVRGRRVAAGRVAHRVPVLAVVPVRQRRAGGGRGRGRRTAAGPPAPRPGRA